MIASPCKNCPRENLPKEKCIRNCRILKAIQEMNSSDDTPNDGCGIDYAEEYAYNFPPSLTSGANVHFWNFGS
jgi:hypothetical protein